MTGDEIIALARASFGEAQPLTVSADNAKKYLNASLKELYEDLPPDRMKNLISTSSVAIVSGKGLVSDTFDKLLEVYVDDIPALQVSKSIIRGWDYGTLFQTEVPIFHWDTENLWVRPPLGAISVVHLDPPNPISNFTLEVSAFDNVFHEALAALVASKMYAQEEDATQAQHYRQEYLHSITSILETQGSEEE